MEKKIRRRPRGCRLQSGNNWCKIQIWYFRLEGMRMDDKVKALLERIRGTAGYAADAAADGVRAAGRRAGQMVDVAKLNVQLFDLNGEYSDILCQLGQVMVDTHRGGLPEHDKVSELLAQADETAAKIAELKGRISDLKQAKVCPSCGAPCGRGDMFCRQCGVTL